MKQLIEFEKTMIRVLEQVCTEYDIQSIDDFLNHCDREDVQESIGDTLIDVLDSMYGTKTSGLEVLLGRFLPQYIEKTPVNDENDCEHHHWIASKDWDAGLCDD